MCPIGYECDVGGGNPDYNYTSFDNFPLALLSSFRLVALDAWNRLYYLVRYISVKPNQSGGYKRAKNIHSELI